MNKFTSITLIYLGFFLMIGIACYYTSSGLPLFALLLLPEFEISTHDENKEKDDEKLEKEL